MTDQTTRPQIDPNAIRPGHVRINGRRTMTHFYRPAFTSFGNAIVSKRRFDTATEADDYAKRVVACWKRVHALFAREPQP